MKIESSHSDFYETLSLEQEQRNRVCFYLNCAGLSATATLRLLMCLWSVLWHRTKTNQTETTQIIVIRMIHLSLVSLGEFAVIMKTENSLFNFHISLMANEFTKSQTRREIISKQLYCSVRSVLTLYLWEEVRGFPHSLQCNVIVLEQPLVDIKCTAALWRLVLTF